jgi:predicted RNA-binding Zn ribbon-like protein
MTENKTGRRRPAKFELIGGNICLDFINTLDGRSSAQPKELLTILTAAQLDFLYERVHLMPDESEETLRRARNLREALYAVFSALINTQAAPQGAMERLNGNIHEAALHSRLVQRAGHCEWQFDELTSNLAGILWPIVRAAADLLTSSDLPQVRACSSPTCQWFFLDTSKNHHRRWCSMKECGNRAKVRRFYAKKKTT